MSEHIRDIMKGYNEQKKFNRYNTSNLTLTAKIFFYDKKVRELLRLKSEHKNEYQNLKSLKSSSINVLRFKLDEMSKKMKSEINRLKQEESRHEESQANESKRIQSQINFLKENNEQLSEVLNEFLARVVHLEHALGINN